MSPYRNPDYTQLLAALGQAARDRADAQARRARAHEAYIEACAAAEAADRAFDAASNAYKNERWP